MTKKDFEKIKPKDKVLINEIFSWDSAFKNKEATVISRGPKVLRVSSGNRIFYLSRESVENIHKNSNYEIY